MKIIFIIIVIVILGVVVFGFNREPAVAPGPENSSGGVYCTQDLNLCPDGSYVGRGGPNCEFGPCPTVKPVFTQSFSPTVSVKISPTVSTTPTLTSKNQIVTIVFANNTANPLNAKIRVGDTVRFVNNDNEQRWPASGLHPTHQICQGFDSLRGLNKGESYSFTFNEVKTCPWHNHLNPSIGGQVVVQD